MEPMLENMMEHMLDETIYLYVVFWITTTRIGKFIRFMTGQRYNHVSLSLFPDLHQCYTFSRHHENVPFFGGFVKESLRRYPRGERTRIKVCKLALDRQEYAALQAYLQPFLERSDDYVYNLPSAATTIFAKRLHLSESYTCVEFVTDALRDSGYIPHIPNFCTIEQLELLLSDAVVYEGAVDAYPQPQSWEEDTYPEHQSFWAAVYETLGTCSRLLYRLCKKCMFGE